MNLLFDYFEPEDVDNGNHIIGLYAGRNFPCNMRGEPEDVAKGNGNITIDTSDDDPHGVDCTVDDECTNTASNDETDDDTYEDNNRMRYVYLYCSS